MKAEERHDLKENDLGTLLQFRLWAFVKNYGSYLLLVLALAFLGFQLYSMYQAKKLKAKVDADSDYRAALQFPTDPKADVVADGIKRLRQVIDDHPDYKVVKAQAYLRIGGFLISGASDPAWLDKNSMKREKALSEAEDAFKNAAENAGDDLLLKGEAQMGLAAICEDSGRWDDAKKAYESMADKNGPFASSPFADLATQRLSTLEARRKVPRLALIELPKPVRPGTPTPIEIPGLPSIPGGMPGIPSLSPLGGSTGSSPFTSPVPLFPGITPIGPPAPGSMPANIPNLSNMPTLPSLQITPPATNPK